VQDAGCSLPYTVLRSAGSRPIVPHVAFKSPKISAVSDGLKFVLQPPLEIWLHAATSATSDSRNVSRATTGQVTAVGSRTI
jgi:hypothetical protein